MKIKHKGSDIYYETSGDGLPLVFLHGFLESATMWNEIIPSFLKSHTIITIDLPGHGRSECASDVHTMEFFAEAVHYVLHHLKFTEATFVGHSMGGYVALAYAELFPDEVSKLILLNSTPAEDSIERKDNRTRALKVIENNPTVFIKLSVTNLFSTETQEKYIADIIQLQEAALRFPISGVSAAIKGMKDRKDRSAVLKNFNKEKYMIAGEADPIIPITTSEILAKYCQTKLIVVDGGHMSHIEEMTKIVKILHFIV